MAVLCRHVGECWSQPSMGLSLPQLHPMVQEISIKAAAPTTGAGSLEPDRSLQPSPQRGCGMDLAPAAPLVSQQAMAVEAFLCLQWAQCTMQ